jgi:ectoine hydroxylase-related dioxygenase (phytanoyl-CoA dioxygenase family)
MMRSVDESPFKQSFEEDGFAILGPVLDSGEISTLTGKISGLDDHRRRAGVRHLLTNPAVATLATDPRLVAIAGEVVGYAAFPFRATLFDKSEESNWLIAWHQDTALPVEEKRETDGWGPWSVKNTVIYAHAPAGALERIIALRVHLDDSTADNGPLRVLPGTHHLGVLSDDAIMKLAQQKTGVSCLIERGGVLAMRPLLIHASSKSRNRFRRRVLHIEYADTRTFAGGVRLASA